MYKRIAIVLLMLGASALALGQSRFIINDRTSDALFVLHDKNGNGVIDEPGEVWRWFDASNVAGTLGPANPTCLGIRANGRVIMGDQGNRNVYSFRDLNNDADALDAGESLVIADATNASGVSFAFPSGVAFDSKGIPYVVNAGNAYGDDGIYSLFDFNNDGDSQDPDEIKTYVGEPAFGPGNGPFSPQEIGIDAVDVGYLHDSASGTRGVYRFEDVNVNGRADDPGEFTVFFDATNASGVVLGAGFALEFDAFRADSLYIVQISSGWDQIIRLTDVNLDKDAQDAGEAEVVFETDEPSFTAIDMVSLNNGDVLLTDSSGDRVLRLTDIDKDGRFMSAGERSDFFANTAGLVLDLRQIAILPISGDLNCDGKVDFDDIDPFVLALGGQAAYSAKYPDCNWYNADCNHDGEVNFDDIDPFVAILSG